MLWGQKLKVYTDHKNLVRDALGLTSDRVYRWRLILEEYNPEIAYIKGSENIVADAVSRLEYDANVNTRYIGTHLKTFVFNKLLNRYAEKTASSVEPIQTYDSIVRTPRTVPACDHGGETYRVSYTNNHVSIRKRREATVQTQQIKETYRYLFANLTSADGDDVYPVTVNEISEAQRASKEFKRYFKDKPFKDRNKYILPRLIEDTHVLVYIRDDGPPRLVIPNTKMQSRIIQWYHYYLQHPGETRFIETLTAVMYWKGMRKHILKHVKTCDRCQKGKRHKRKYGHLPPKVATIIPWKQVCVDLVGPYTIKAKNGTILDFMCLTMIDPATGWFEIVELPNCDVTYVRNGEEVVKVIIDKSSASVARLFNSTWLSRYPRAQSIIYDNGSEFKLYFEQLCESFGLKRKPTTVKNPQANAILERMHAVVTDMLKTSNLDMQDTCTPEMIQDLLTNVGWAIRSTYHTVLGASPGAAIYGRDMLFDIPYVANWADIGKRRQKQVDKSCELKNKLRVDFDYRVGQKVLLFKDGILRKAEDPYEGPYVITDVYTNGTVRIQRGTLNERLNIRRLHPYFER